MNIFLTIVALALLPGTIPVVALIAYPFLPKRTQQVIQKKLHEVRLGIVHYVRRIVAEARAQEVKFLNTSRLRFRKAHLGIHDKPQLGKLEQALADDDTLEMVLPREVVDAKKATRGRMVVYTRDKRQLPFGYFLGRDRSGRIHVKRFDKVLVRRSPRTVAVLA